MNHSIAQLVTCLKNGQMARKERVIIPSSKLKISVLEILKKEGFVKNFLVENNGSFDVLEITLGYNGIQPVIKEIEVISTPGRRVYAGVDEIPVVYNGLGIVVLSTPKGVMTDYEAKNLNVGGELLLKVF
ncbi:MAG: 30S ribosomal protein S8 [Rickettsiales bacterium]|jgi:small subunit ribosomal protein S8|nr:30S ribosomal protein S8 [Rickettsiales bacterium]